MSILSQGHTRTVLAVFRVVTILVMTILLLVPEFGARTLAQGGGIAVSGSFSGREFEVVQGGTEIGGTDLFLVVFNNSAERLDFTADFDGPPSVEVAFSESKFALDAGQQKRISLTLKALEGAVPGVYDLLATVTASRVTSSGGIGVGAAVAQRARVTVVGDSGFVEVRVSSLEGHVVVSHVRLIRAEAGRETEVAFSDTGTLEARVAPGSYIARADLAGANLAEESFDIAPDETKSLEFSVRTVSISEVNLTPRYRAGSTEMSLVTLAYHLNNLDQPLEDVQLVLNVRKDGADLEETPILSLDNLNVGSTTGSHNYIPSAGWSSGIYRLKVDLYIGGGLYTTSLDTELAVDMEASVPAPPAVATQAPSTPTLVPATPVPLPTQSIAPTRMAAEASAATPVAGSTSDVARLDLAGKVSSNGQVLQDIILVSQDRRATIKIPEGALAFGAQGQPLAFLEIRQAPQPNSLQPDNSLIGVAYDFGPDDATFAPPANISLGYDPAAVPSGGPTGQLAILRYDRDQGWMPLDTSVDAANSVASARTSHFTQFALAALTPSPSSDLPLLGRAVGAAAAALLVVIAITVRATSRKDIEHPVASE